MLKSSAVRYRHRTVLARHVFFSCCWAAGGAAPGATAARWRSSSGRDGVFFGLPEQVIPIQLAGKNFADTGGDFGGDLGPSATDEQLLFRAWKVFVCRRHYFPRESATRKYYAICADTAGGFFARRYRRMSRESRGETKWEWHARVQRDGRSSAGGRENRSNPIPRRCKPSQNLRRSQKEILALRAGHARCRCASLRRHSEEQPSTIGELK